MAEPSAEPRPPFALNPEFVKAIDGLYRAFVDAYVASLCTLAVEEMVEVAGPASAKLTWWERFARWPHA